MKKFLQTMLLLAALMLPWATRAQDTVTIGDGTNTYYYGPYNSLWGYSFVEMIYPDSLIGTAGTITEVSFYLGTANSAQTNDYDVFMKNVTRGSFADNTDFETVDSSDIVFSGTWTISGEVGWVTLVLDTPFQYDGTSNLMIAMHEKTQGYSTRYFRCTSASHSLFSAHNDNIDPNPYDLNSFTGTTYTQDIRPNVQLLIQPGAGGTATTVTIGDTASTDTYYYLPINMYFNYSLTQQLFTPEEIGGAGTITSISFDYTYTSAFASSGVQMYMKNVTKTSFAHNLDMEPISASDLVWTDTLKADGAGWITINLDTPFEYDGTSNLLVCCYDPTSGYPGSNYKFRASNCSGNLALDYYSDSYVPDLTNVNSFSGSKVLHTYRNVIRLGITPAAGPVCARPAGLAATVTPGSGTIATLNWVENGTATAWEVEYGTASDFSTATAVNATDTFLNLTGLTAEATYYARVRAICGAGDTSNWSAVCNFTPSNLYSITINDGTTTNGYVPIYGYYCDENTHSKFIIPATDLASIQMSLIDTLTFYASNSSVSWGSAQFTVYMTETSATTLSEFGDYSGMTQVMAVGSLSISNGIMKVILTEPYLYMGGNLMIAFDQPTSGSYSSCSWYGVSATGASYGGYGTSSVYQQNFLPKMTIYFTPVGADYCWGPATLVASNVTASGATLTWASTAASSYQLEFKKASATTWMTMTLTDTTYTLTGLNDFTAYQVRVKAICSAESHSSYKTASFTTLEGCPTGNVCIGTGYNTNDYLPTYNYYKYSLTQQIYTADEIDTIGDIETLAFYSTGGLSRNMDIYMVNTTKTSFDSVSDWIPVTAANRVFSGTVNFNANEWNVITLDNPFSYTGTGNVAIIVDDNNGWYGGTIPFFVFDADSSAIEIYSDNTDYDPFNPTQYSGTIFNVKNRVRLGIGPLTTCLPVRDLAAGNVTKREVTLTWIDTTNTGATYTVYDMSDTSVVATGITGTTYTATGLTPETSYTFGVAANCSATDASRLRTVSATTLERCQTPSLTVDDVFAYGATAHWTGTASSYNVRYRPAQNFGQVLLSTSFDTSSLSGWTNIDGDGDSNVWVLGSAAGGVYLDAGSSLAGTGHNGSADFVCSGSYSNYTDAALTPDNYLVSPQVQLGGAITFWATAQDAAYPYEHFGVAVSTTGNTDTADFTTIAEWTLNADGTGTSGGGHNAKDQGAWGQFTVDLSAYAGQTGYVAIRHFNCSDQFLLNIDDITIYGPSQTTNDWIDTTVTGNSFVLSGLTAETDYVVQVQANCGAEDSLSSWASANFSTNDVPCYTPTRLAVDHVRTNRAALSWYGYASDYNVRSRANYYYTNFNTGDQRSGWIWEGDIIYGLEDPVNGYSSNDNYFLQMGWATTNETYIFSPEMPEYASGATLVFHYFSYNDSNTFQLGYSTTTGDTSAFTWSSPIQATPGSYYSTQYSEVLPAGVKYIAFKSSSVDQNHCIFIDNFGIVGDWQNTTATGNSVLLTGLDSLTPYLVQVQSNCGVTDSLSGWSAPVTFTTDSVDNLVFVNDTVTACDSYTWRGTAYTASTTVVDTVMVLNADSIFTLVLTVNYSNTGIETVTACDSSVWHGTTYTTSTNTPTFTSTNVAGCDSVTTLHLTINYSNTGIETVTACNSYVWHGTEYTASTNTPTYTTTNAAGCDSVTTLHLTIIECSTTDITTCDSYTWYGTTYTASGTYYHGTDTLNLTLNYSTTGTDNQAACDSLLRNNVWYTTSTSFVDSLETTAGCDSIVNVTLTINYSFETVDTVAATDSYTWHDSVYTQSGTYYYHDQTIAGCDSTEILVLSVTTYYSVSVVVANTEGLLNVGGAVTGTGSYLAGTEVTLTAIPDSGYLFDGWYTRAATGFGGELIESDSIYTITLDSNIVLVAMFERIGSNSALLTVAVDTALGQVLFNGQEMPFNVYSGTLNEEVTLTAVAINNSTFLGWVNAAGDTLSTEAVYTITLDQTTMSLTAAFRAYVGINTVEAANVSIITREGGVVVRGAGQTAVNVYDVAGRLVGHVAAASDEQYIRLPQTGVYLVKVAGLPAKRVVVRQ